MGIGGVGAMQAREMRLDTRRVVVCCLSLVCGAGAWVGGSGGIISYHVTKRSCKSERIDQSERVVCSFMRYGPGGSMKNLKCAATKDGNV